MALAHRGKQNVPRSKQSSSRETSPERTRIWAEPLPKKKPRVPVVYYLSRNGLLEHPHFIEVPLSSHSGLFLKDFINRLNSMRGKGVAMKYSWSSKRSYKNGFVWQDLSESDFIYPAHGQEYVLKGSELLEAPPTLVPSVLICSQNPTEVTRSIAAADSSNVTKKFEQHQGKVFEQADLTAQIPESAADASTQTDDLSPAWRRSENEIDEDPRTELSGGDFSPPQSSSSMETPDSTARDDAEEARMSDPPARRHFAGKARASAVLRQLISCGSLLGPAEHGVSMISRLAVSLPSGVTDRVASRDEVRKKCFRRRPMVADPGEIDSGECDHALLDPTKRSSSFSLTRS